MVTINGKKIRGSFINTHQTGADSQFMLLLASHLAGMATHAVFPVKH
jgi:hypothetical protein